MNMKAIVSVLSVLMASAVFGATSYTWQPVDDDWDGDFTDPTHWAPDGTAFPGASEFDTANLYIHDASDAGLDYTVRFPEGTFSNKSILNLSAFYTGRIVLDGTGTTWARPTGNNNLMFSAKQKSKIGGSDEYPILKADYGGFTFTDFRIVLTNSPTERRVVFERGTATIDGGGAKHIFKDGANKNQLDTYIDVEKDASLTISGNLYFCAPGSNNFVRVRGGKMAFSGNARMFFPNYGNRSDFAFRRDNGVIVTDGGLLSFSGSTWGFGCTPADDNKGYSTNLVSSIIADNGRVTAPAGFRIEAHGAGKAFFTFTNGSTVTLSPTSASFGDNLFATGVVTVVDSTLAWDGTGGMVFGGSTAERVGKGAWGALNVVRSTFSMSQAVTCYSGHVALTNAAVTLTGTTACLKGNATTGGTPVLSVDGVTLTTAQSATAEPISGFTTATIGAGGLTINAPTAVTVSQAFAGPGTLTLAGAGAKTLSGAVANDVSVLAGDLICTAPMTGALSMPNGGNVSLGGTAAQATPLAGLTLGSATAVTVLKLLPGETIHVDGDVSLGAVQLILNGSFPVGTTAAIVATGAVSEATKRAWLQAVVAEGLVAGTMWRTTCTEAAGVTRLGFEVVADAPIVIAQASGEETHATNIAFDVGQTLTTDVAAGATQTFAGEMGLGRFVKDGAGVTYLTNDENVFASGIELRSGLLSSSSMDALGLSIGSLLSRLRGGVLEITGGGETEGSFVIDASASDTAPVIVKNDADVTMPVPSAVQGGFIKRGTGNLTLKVATDTDLSALKAGTIDSNLVLTFDETTSALTTGGYSSFNVTEGHVTFRGTAATPPKVKLNTLAVGEPTSAAVKTPVGVVFDHVAASLSGFGPLSEKARPTNADGAWGATFALSNGASFTCNNFTGGSGSGNPASLSAPKTFRRQYVIDNATLTVSNEFRPDDLQYGTNYYRIANGGAIYLTQLSYHGRCFVMGGSSVIMDFDHGKIAYNQAGDPVTFANESNVDGGTFSLNFANGSHCGIYPIYGSAWWTPSPESKICPRPLNFTFDDSEWYVGAGNKYLASTNCNVIITAKAGGLRMNPPAGSIWRMHQKISGEGGLVKGGAGTFTFCHQQLMKEWKADTVTWAFAGAATVTGGTLRVTCGAATNVYARIGGEATLDLDGASFTNGDIAVIGPATVTDATLTDTTLRPGYDEASGFAAATFADVTLDGKTVVDFGRTAENPLPEKVDDAVVLRWTGVKPDVSGWKTRNTGVRGQRCAYTANDDGTVTLKATPKGLVLIVR